MQLAWERHDVVRVTARTSELAALVAAARLAHAALAASPGEQAEHLGRVLAAFDRASRSLQAASQPAPSHRPDESTPMEVSG